MKKRILSMIVTVCMLLTMLPTAAFATESDNTQTTLDVSKGNIVIGDGSLDAYKSDGTHLTDADPDGYIITGMSHDKSKTVTITGGRQKITIKDLYIFVGDSAPVIDKIAAFQVTGGHLELTILGENRLESGSRRAGLELSGENTSLTITASSTGSLQAAGGDYCAGIGTASSSTCGNITIAGGSISANAGYDCETRIGANPESSTCGTITITGGKFTEGSVGSNTVYGISVADGYYVSYLGDSDDYCYAVTNRAPAQIEKDNIQTVLDISKGLAHIDENYVDGYDSNGNRVTTYDPDGYIITGTTTYDERPVRVTGGSHKITINDLNLTSNGTMQRPAFAIENASVELTVTGTNTLSGGQLFSGLAVIGAYSSLTITKESTGSLTAIGGVGKEYVAGAPGIGSSGVCGSIVIEGGSITAIAGQNDGTNEKSENSIGVSVRGICFGDIVITGGNINADNGKISTLGQNYFAAGGTGEAGEVRITGGNFVTGDVTANTIYGIELPAGYLVVQETGDFPYHVVANICTVTLKANGSVSDDVVVDDVIGYYTLPACPFDVPDGKYFKGWATTATGDVITDTSILVNENTELYAIWDDVYTVSFDANGGTGSMPAITLNGVSKYTLPECSFVAPNNNYTFGGWSTTSTGDSLLGNSIEVSADTTIYAIWNVLSNDVEINQKNFPDANFRAYVSANLDSDKNGKLSSIEIKNTTELRISSKGITDLTGIEYFIALTSLDCTQNNLTSLDLSKNVLLTNRNFNGWGNTYDITVNSMDGTFDLTNLPGKFDVSKTSYWMNENYVMLTVSDNTLTVPFDFSSQTWASTIVYNYDCGNNLTATFTLNVASAEDMYTISFDKNGGTGAMASKYNVAGNIALPACTFTAPAGKQFKGWATVADGEVISGTTITVNANTTLYAIWEEIPAVTVSSIAVNSTTHKIAYTVGDALDVTDLTILVTKSDNSTETVNVTTGMVSGFDSTSAVDRQTLTITYEGKTTTYDISVAAAPVPTVTLSGIAVTTAPSKTVYTAGEDFDATGMVVTATYSDQSTAPVTGYTVTDGNALTAGKATVTISYTEGDVTKTTTQAIVVNKIITSLDLGSGDAHKYYDGQPIADPTEGELTFTGAERSDIKYTWKYAVWTDSTCVEGDVLENAPVDAGEYWFIASIEETNDRTGSSDRKRWVIEPLSLFSRQVISDKTVIRNSQVEQRIDLPELPEGIGYVISQVYLGTTNITNSISEHFTKLAISGTTLVYSGTESMELGDEYDVTISVDSDNYSGNIFIDGLTVADKINLGFTTRPSFSQNQTYNGQPQVLINAGVSSEGGVMQYKMGDGEWGANIPTATDVGTYWFYAQAVPTSENEAYYTASSVVSIQVKILPAPVTITPTDKTVVVNGTAPSLENPILGTDYTVSGLFGDDTLTTPPTLAYADTPDTSTVGNTTVITASGAEAGSNYTITYGEGTLNVVESYALTISGGGSGATGAGSYTEGTVVTINAGTKSNYTFSGWTSSNGGSFANASSASTTFTMPAGDVTITTNWTYSGGGGGGSSSSGGSSNTTTTTEKNDDGSTTTTTTNKVTGTVTETTKNPDGSTETVETKKDGTVTTTVKDADGSTTKTVETPDGTVEAEATVSNKAGNEIVADAKENGASQVVIAPEIPSDATKTEVSIPASTVGNIGSQTDADLTISTPVADVSIPNGGLSELAHEGGQVTVAAEKSGNTVELTVTAGRETVTDLPGGITLTVPHEDATPGTVAVLVKEDGTREVIRKSVSDDGAVSIPLDGSATVELIDNSKDFTDTNGHWAGEAIDFVTSRELYAGTSATTFTPNGSMTRAMLARVLHNLESNPDHDFEGTFHDLDGHWATDSIHWAADRGIVSGYPDGSYGADDNITREQLAVMLWRYAGSPETDHGLDHFRDAGNIGSYARMALAWANENGIIGGIGNNTLDPKGDATRAQVATMLMRMMQRM